MRIATALRQAVALVPLLTSTVAAQEGKPPVPDMATGGSDRQTPGQTVVAERPDEILARNIIGQPLYGRNSERLGTVKDGLVDRGRSSVDVLIVDVGTGENPLRPVAWSSIDPRDRKHITADLAKSDLDSATPALPDGGTPGGQGGQQFFSLAAQLLDRPVLDRAGTSLGYVRDAVLHMANGKLVAVLIAKGGVAGIGLSGAPRAVPWNAVAGPAQDNQPITLALTKDEFEKEPAFISMAPAPAQSSGPFTGVPDDRGTDRSRPMTQGPVKSVPPPSPPPNRRSE